MRDYPYAPIENYNQMSPSPKPVTPLSPSAGPLPYNVGELSFLLKGSFFEVFDVWCFTCLRIVEQLLCFQVESWPVLFKWRRKLIPKLVVDEMATTFGNWDLRICVVSFIVSISNHKLSGELQGLLGTQHSNFYRPLYLPITCSFSITVIRVKAIVLFSNCGPCLERHWVHSYIPAGEDPI